jgi:hypothetical protein
MDSLAKTLCRKLAVLLGFAAMVTVNYLAAMGKINGTTPASISNKYPSLFTPEPYTFSIWGLIYLLLAVYVLFQLFSKEFNRDGRKTKTAFWFSLSCIVNIGWIFTWHYDQILVSTIAMVVLLYCLTRILSLVSGANHAFGNLIGLELPFGLYTGWITVATVANISVFLVSLGWDGFGLAPFIWLIIVLLIATFIAVSTTRDTKNVAYPAAVIWGFIGILVPYISQFRIDVKLNAMWIVITLGVCLIILAVRWIGTIANRLK